MTEQSPTPLQKTPDGPESVPEASGGELAGRNGDRSAEAVSGGSAHACGNCEGIDPDTCWTNPDRPPEPDPAEENSASWSHLVIDRGRDLLIPWDNCDGLVAGSVWIHRNDVPRLIQQLAEAIGPDTAEATQPQEQP